MEPFENVIQLEESIEYPDGYNVITVTGTGDVRSEQIFSRVSVIGPATLGSAGEIGTCSVSITDINSANPFEYTSEEESASASSPYEASASKYIVLISGVWEVGSSQADKDHAIPLDMVVFEGTKIHISEEFVSALAPAGYGTGLVNKSVWVEYIGCSSVAMATGAQTEDDWWDHLGAAPPTDESDPTDVGGAFYADSAGQYVIDDNAIPIPNTTGQTVTVPVYFKAKAGANGTATINAAYDGIDDAWRITIGMGGNGFSVNVTATPSSIPAGTSSIVELRCRDAGGAAIIGETAEFDIISGGGSLQGSTALLERVNDITEEVTSSSFTSLSLGYPVINITSITAPAWTWDGTYEIDESGAVTFVGNPLPFNEYPVTVVYDYGGYACCTYTAAADATLDSTIYISGRVGATNGLAAITICATSLSDYGTITITPTPATIAKSGTSDLLIVACTDTDAPAEGSITLGAGPYGSTAPRAVALTTEAIVAGAGTIQDRRTVTVDYPIVSVTSVTFLGTDYAVESFAGKTITLTEAGSLPVVSGTAEVNYTAGGIARAVYTAANRDYYAFITASHTFTSSTILIDGEPATALVEASCGITVGDGVHPGTIRISLFNFYGNQYSGYKKLNVDGITYYYEGHWDEIPESLHCPFLPERETKVYALLEVADINGQFQRTSGKTLTFSKSTLISGVSVYPATAVTDNEGLAFVYLKTTTSGTGSVNVCASYLGTEGQVDIPVGWSNPTVIEYVTIPLNRITATLSPTTTRTGNNALFTVTGTGGAVWLTDAGAANACDLSGRVSVDTFLSNAPLVLNFFNSLCDTDIVDVAIQNGTGSGTVSMEIDWSRMRRLDPFAEIGVIPQTGGEGWDYSHVYLKAMWPCSANNLLEQRDEIIIKSATGLPVSGATVTIQGVQKTTDSWGVATFTGLPPGTWPVTITHPNYLDSTADGDVTNDTYTVQAVVTSDREFQLADMSLDVMISVKIPRYVAEYIL